ncbi:MAG: hypothetical protein KDC52_14480, partial [Ignavibacteriae bacterium]|nr:hypothetical protein [Ignavibacteriota bacterium]
MQSKRKLLDYQTSEGVNETAIDLFATLTAVMMLIATVFITTMTNQSGQTEKDVAEISDQYYLIDFGYKDLKEELSAANELEDKLNGSLLKIGNHVPSLWRVEGFNKRTENLTLNYSNLMDREKSLKTLLNNLTRDLNYISYRIKDQEHIYIKEIISNSEDIKANNFTIYILPDYIYLFMSLGDHPPNDLSLTWVCNNNFDCDLSFF